MLQLLLNRLMKHRIAVEASECSQHTVTEQKPLTYKEQNHILYMAAHMVRKMKNFKERIKQPEMQKKRHHPLKNDTDNALLPLIQHVSGLR